MDTNTTRPGTATYVQLCEHCAAVFIPAFSHLLFSRTLQTEIAVVRLHSPTVQFNPTATEVSVVGQLKGNCTTTKMICKNILFFSRGGLKDYLLLKERGYCSS